MARTAKKKIAVYDEGVLLTADADSLNFAGAGVAGSITSGNNVKEDISGVAGGSQVRDEVPSGSGTSFTLAHTPTANTLQLFRGGAKQQPGVGNDYTLSGASITLAVTLASGEILSADYAY